MRQHNGDDSEEGRIRIETASVNAEEVYQERKQHLGLADLHICGKVARNMDGLAVVFAQLDLEDIANLIGKHVEEMEAEKEFAAPAQSSELRHNLNL